MNNARFIIQASKGLIRHSQARRTLMFYDVLILLVLIFLGSTVLWAWLREHPFIFLGYWGFCVWLTLLAILLAVYDMAMVRLDAKRAQRELEQEYLKQTKDAAPHDDPHAS